MIFCLRVDSIYSDGNRGITLRTHEWIGNMQVNMISKRL